jgi:cell division protein FtsZ
LEISIEGAKGVLFNITGGPDLTMAEVDEAAKQIASAVDPDANIIFGATIDQTMVDQVKITVIATGFDETKKRLRELSGQPSYRTVAQPQVRSVQPQQPPLPQVPDELPPEEDEFDIPAFLRQRS